jgi:hypothetical protein
MILIACGVLSLLVNVSFAGEGHVLPNASVEGTTILVVVAVIWLLNANSGY